MISGDTNAPLVVDFRWASDATPVGNAPIQPVHQLTIDAVAEPESDEAVGADPPTVSWTGD
jgi:hypothetical protein